MNVEIIREIPNDVRVRFMGAHWLDENRDTLFWWNDAVDHKNWFTDIHKPTPEELVLFELEFGKEVLDFVFSSNKKMEIMYLWVEANEQTIHNN